MAKSKKKGDWFTRFSSRTAQITGRPTAFGLAVLIVAIWAVAGPFTGYSEVWQLTINTGTTIITFLMVFLIQHTQNRDSAAIHIKLDELIRAVEAAQNSLLDLEELSEEDLETFRSHYMQLAALAREKGVDLGAIRDGS